MDASGTIRVLGTRVTLDTLVNFYLQGYTADQLHKAFPTVPPADIQAVLAYYFIHRPEVDAYIAEGQRRAEEQRQAFEAEFPPRPIRPELLERFRATREAGESAGPRLGRLR